MISRSHVIQKCKYLIVSFVQMKDRFTYSFEDSFFLGHEVFICYCS